MKKVLASLLVFTSFISANAQSYLGFYHDNYAGVQGVLFNPSSIVDSRFKTDINLISGSASVGNDVYGVKIMDIFKDGYDFDKQAKKSFTNSNNAVFNADIMGPSFMFNIAPKHSLAVFTRARAFGNVLNVDGKLINEFSKKTTETFDIQNTGNPTIAVNSWAEIGLSYAAVLMQKGQHFLKGGFSLKYLQGIAGVHAQSNNSSVKYNVNATNPLDSDITTTGNLVYGSSQDFEKIETLEIDAQSKGFGLDLGLTYEWRPDFDASTMDVSNFKELNKYKLRIGFSVTDLGSFVNNQGVRNRYDLNKTIKESDFKNADNNADFLNNTYPKTIDNSKINSNLPTALHADVDWNIHNKFYLNFNSDFSLVDKTALNQNSIANRLSVTPRFEARWFTFSVPVSYMDYSKQPLVGLGLRTGILFIGSSSLLTNVISDNSRAADLYLGLKIPVYQKKLKDKDADGVFDKFDACPDVAGPVENKGCPWPDTDGDSVLDKDDTCINVKGPVENKGCPWEDTDKDGVLDKDDKCPKVAGVAANNGCPWGDSDNDGVLDKDDKCPKVAGPVENKGCPWLDTDKDGILDKDDKCPKVAGIAANNGCPEEKKVDAVVLKKLNDFAKSIMFDSGKATIRAVSFEKLEEIVKVMAEYESTSFKLEGYTDNTGSAAKNLSLSKERAAAIKDYLISKGVNTTRLSSEGYGIVKPIADNKTAAGRALNRRVEIILVK